MKCSKASCVLYGNYISREACKHDIRPRWPHSSVKPNVPLGKNCPYAHHVSELKFEQEINEQIRLRHQRLKNLMKAKDPVIYREWIPTGPLLDCIGCGETYVMNREKGKSGNLASNGICGFCRYRQHNAMIIAKEKAGALKENAKILKAIQYHEKKTDEFDTHYEKKFGILKQAIVLNNYDRVVEANNLLTEALKAIKQEDEGAASRFEKLEAKWLKKLNLTEHKIPKDILNYQISQDLLDYFKITAPLNSMMLYAENMRNGTNFSMYNRHTYLNQQINDFDAKLKSRLKEMKKDVTRLEDKISTYNFISKNLHKAKPDSADPKMRYYAMGHKSKMCPNLKNGGKCPKSNRDCEFAHSANQLNLTIIDNDLKMLEKNKQAKEQKITVDKQRAPWRYSKDGQIEPCLFIISDD